MEFLHCSSLIRSSAATHTPPPHTQTPPFRSITLRAETAQGRSNEQLKAHYPTLNPPHQRPNPQKYPYYAARHISINSNLAAPGTAGPEWDLSVYLSVCHSPRSVPGLRPPSLPLRVDTYTYRTQGLARRRL